MHGEKKETFRIESDSMGDIPVPSWAYWGAQTQRAVANFSISGLKMPAPLIRALGAVKAAAAAVNAELGLLEKRAAQAVLQAAREVREGAWDAHFPVDVFQTGSGTSWNMNANEVIANRANEILGSPLGAKAPVHPNDHVNRSQSSNDAIPTAINIADRLLLDGLAEALGKLGSSLARKAKEFSGILKLGRTHLQDAVPMTLGQEFEGYARQAEKARERVLSCRASLEELPIGGTAVGTGINSHPEFARRAVEEISRLTGIRFREAGSRFEAQGSRDAQVELMGALNTAAVSLSKIVNDLRLLSSGPRAGLGEIELPSLQPGSSIMPGKVNPVIPEMVIQAAAHVMGKCLSVSIGGMTGPLELNMMMPLLGFETVGSLELLTNACAALADRCIDGITADEEKCRDWIEHSLALVTPLSIRLGYDKAAAIAKMAYEEKKTVREIVVREGLLTAKEADSILDPGGMIKP